MADSPDEAGVLDSQKDADRTPRSSLELSSLDGLSCKPIQSLPLDSSLPPSPQSRGASGPANPQDVRSNVKEDTIPRTTLPVAGVSSSVVASSSPGPKSSQMPRPSIYDGSTAPVLPGVFLISDVALDSLRREYTWGYPGTRRPPGSQLAKSIQTPPRHQTYRWSDLPPEIHLYILSFLSPKDLVRASIVSKEFHSLCFDGQLWASLDTTWFYRDIPAAGLAYIVKKAGPFIKHLNMRGCVQMDSLKKTEGLAKFCTQLVSASFEGCRRFDQTTLHGLLVQNQNLVHLNLSGLLAFSNAACERIANHCPLLESLNVSWCQKIEAKSLKLIVDSCTRLRDLRASEISGFDCVQTAQSIFKANKLERLVLSGCLDLNDECLGIMMHGSNPEVDFSTGIPIVPKRELRHLDLSRCVRLTDDGVQRIGYVTPKLQGLLLSKCKRLTNEALERIFASCPKLTHLDLDELGALTDALFSEHLAKAPCAEHLRHLSLSYCARLGDAGLLPIIKNCVRLRSVELDNTRISDAVLLEAAAMVRRRSAASTDAHRLAKVTLRMAVFDCPDITWIGIAEVMDFNSEIRRVGGSSGQLFYPTEIISLKCFYGYQMTVDMHEKRVLRGDLSAAVKLKQKWAEFMHTSDVDFYRGTSHWRRRRRERRAPTPEVLGGTLTPLWPLTGSLGSTCVMM